VASISAPASIIVETTLLAVCPYALPLTTAINLVFLLNLYKYFFISEIL